MSQRQTQCDRLIRLFESRSLGALVALPEILDLRIASYTKRIHELRSQGYLIEMVEGKRSKEGKRFIYYQLLGKLSNQKQLSCDTEWFNEAKATS